MIGDTPGQRPSDAGGPQPGLRRPRAIGPELVAAVLSAVIVVVLGGGVLAGGPAAPVAPTASQVASSPTIRPAATPVLDKAAIATCLEIDARLAADRVALQAELAAKTFEPGNVATILRSLNADVVTASVSAGRLLELPASEAVGTSLMAAYTALHQRASAALDNSLQNGPAYHAAAVAIIALLADLPALDAALKKLRDGLAPPPSASPSPAPSASGSPPAPPSEPPSAPPPTQAPSGSPGAATANSVVNPGFESGVGSPWELVIASGSSATLLPDPTVHNSGSSSARVDIAAAGTERAAVAVRQGGFAIASGSHYLATIAVRADSAREVRLRIASAGGDTYATRLFTVGPAWQVLTIDSTVLASDVNAYLEIDLGRFTATTWLDDASFTQIAATGG